MKEEEAKKKTKNQKTDTKYSRLWKYYCYLCFLCLWNLILVSTQPSHRSQKTGPKYMLIGGAHNNKEMINALSFLLQQ